MWDSVWNMGKGEGCIDKRVHNEEDEEEAVLDEEA